MSQASLQPFPLDDEFRCPICLDELSPCLIYSGCNHRICANCVTTCGTRCPLCRQSSPPRPDHQYSGLVEKQMKFRRFRCTRCGVSDITSEAASKNQHTCSARPDALSARYRNLAGGGGLHASNQTSMISDRAIRMIVCDALGVDNYGLNGASSSSAALAAATTNKNDENRVIDAILSEAARLSELKRLSQTGTIGSIGLMQSQKNFLLATKGSAAVLASQEKLAKDAPSSLSSAPTMASALMMNAPSLSTSSFLSKDAPSLDGTSDKTSTVYIDFDYLASSLFLADPSYNHKKGKIRNMSHTYTANVVVEILNAIAKRLVDAGLSPSVTSIRFIAVGVAYSFRDQEMLLALRDRFTPGVEILVVSDTRKKDDIERQLEDDFAEARADGTVVLVSGDVDFLGSTSKLVREGKVVVIVHNSARGTVAEKHVGVAGANSMWRVADLVSPASEAHKYLSQHHHNQQEVEGLFSNDKSKKTLEQPELINKQKAFGHGKATSSEWAVDPKRPDHKYILVSGVVGHATSEVLVQDTRMRGPSSVFTTAADAKNHNGNLFIIAAPNQRVAATAAAASGTADLVAVAAFPENWEVLVSGNSTQLKNLEPTAGLETFLLAAGAGCANQKLEWCRAGEGCKRGICCVNAHKRGTPSIVQVSAAPQKPAFSYAAMAANIGEINNSGATTVIAAASPTHHAVISPKNTPASLNNTTTAGADKISVPIGNTGNIAIVELVNVAGEKMPVTDVEPTSVFQFYKKHPQGIGKICVNYPDCDRGIQCMFVHLKKLTFEEGLDGGAVTVDSGNVSTQQASTPVVSSTTTFPSMPSISDAASPASRKQRKAQQMQQEENVPTPAAASSVTTAANSAAALESAKKALSAASKMQSNIANPTTIAAAAALAAAAANPHGESIHNLPHDVNVEGMMIPLYKLEKNGIVEFAKRHAAQPAKWCLHFPHCKGNVKCGFAHPGKNYDKDSIIEDAVPGFEIEGASNVTEAVTAVIDIAAVSKESSAAAAVAAAKKKHATADDIEKAFQKTPEKTIPSPQLPAAVVAAAKESKSDKPEKFEKWGSDKHHQQQQQQQQNKPEKITSTAAASHVISSVPPPPPPVVITSSVPSFSSMAAKGKDAPVKEQPKEPIRITAVAPPRIISQPPPPGQKPVPVKLVNVDGEFVPITELERTAVFDFVKTHPDGIAKWCVHDPGCKHGEKCTFAHRKWSDDDSANANTTTTTTAMKQTTISYRAAAASGGGGAEPNPLSVWQTDDPREFNVENVIVPRSKIERTGFVDYLKTHQGVIGKWCLKHPECRKGADCSYVHRKQ